MDFIYLFRHCCSQFQMKYITILASHDKNKPHEKNTVKVSRISLVSNLSHLACLGRNFNLTFNIAISSEDIEWH